jgi:NitT/TauT family transport system substrate-binding protein
MDKINSTRHWLRRTARSKTVGRRTVIKGLSAATAVVVLPPMGSVFGAETVKATISEAVHLGFYIPIYVAKNKGLFAKHGIDMSIKSAGGIAQPVPALISGEAQFAVTGTGMSVNSTVEGGRMINVAKIVGHLSVWVVGKPGTVVNSIADLKGKTIATLRYPSNTITTPTYAMKSVGGYSPEEGGVKFLQLPFGAQLVAVTDGRADLATVFEWDASIGENQFGLKTLFSLGKILGPAAFTSTFVTEDLRKQKPELVQNYCNAIAEAQKLLHTDPSVFIEVSAIEFPKIDPAVIQLAIGRFFGEAAVVPRNPIITKTEWDAIMKHELSAGSLRRELPFEEMVDNSFAEKATRQFGLS